MSAGLFELLTLPRKIKWRQIGFRGREMKFPLVTVMKNLLYMFTASAGIAREGQCIGVQNCVTGEMCAFLLHVRSGTHHDRCHRKSKNQFVVRRTWIFSRKMTSGMSYLVL